MDKFFNYIKRQSERKDIIGFSIQLLYAVFSSPFWKTIIGFALSVIIIPIIITQYECDSLSSIFTNIPHAKLYLTGILSIYGLSYLAEIYSTRYKPSFKALKTSSRKMNECLALWITHLDKLLNDVSQSTSLIEYSHHYKSHSDYKIRAALICNLIYTMIEKSYDIDDHQVSIMHKAKSKEKGSFIKMIAFSNKSDTTPGCFYKYFRFTDQKENKYLHTKLFKDNHTKIVAIHNRTDLLRQYHYEDEAKRKNEKIQQYIGIPICDCFGQMVSLIQIQTESKNLFGNNVEQIENMADNVFVPLANILRIWYHKDMLARRHSLLISSHTAS